MENNKKDNCHYSDDDDNDNRDRYTDKNDMKVAITAKQ